MKVACVRMTTVVWLVCLHGAWAGSLVDIRMTEQGTETPGLGVRYRTGRAYDYAWLYRSLGKTARASGCPCLPSCSAYTPQAVEKHGLLGVVMTVDRFLRESEDMGSRKWVSIGKQKKLFDPVEDNDYWFRGKVASSRCSAYYARELVREWTGLVSIDR